MKKILVTVLMTMAFPAFSFASEAADDFSLKITSVVQERSKDNNAQKEEITLTGKTLKYKKTFSGYLRILGIKDQEKETTINDDYFNKIKGLFSKLQALPEKELAYATDEIGVFYIIAIDAEQNGKTETVKISGMSKYLNDNPLYSQANCFISDIRKIVLEK